MSGTFCFVAPSSSWRFSLLSCSTVLLLTCSDQYLERCSHHDFLFSSPVMRPLSILAISSSMAFRLSCACGSSRFLRLASSKSGTHSCTEPRAMVKKFFRSGFVNRPLPSVMFAAMEREARLSWSARK